MMPTASSTITRVLSRRIRIPGYFAYRNLGHYAAPWSTYGDGVTAAQKGIGVGTSYTLFKDIQLFAKYFNGKDIMADKDASRLFVRIDVFF